MILFCKIFNLPICEVGSLSPQSVYQGVHISIPVEAVEGLSSLAFACVQILINAARSSQFFHEVSLDGRLDQIYKDIKKCETKMKNSNFTYLHCQFIALHHTVSPIFFKSLILSISQKTTDKRNGVRPLLLKLPIFSSIF